MKTSLDLTTEIFKLVNVTAVKSVINGGVYKTLRPVDSVKEDVVINSITLGGGTFQLGTANVNIYVADMPVSVNGVTQYFANETRLKTITDIVAGLLDYVVADEYDLYVEATNLIGEPETKQHYVNIRVQFRFNNPH